MCDYWDTHVSTIWGILAVSWRVFLDEVSTVTSYNTSCLLDPTETKL